MVGWIKGLGNLDYPKLDPVYLVAGGLSSIPALCFRVRGVVNESGGLKGLYRCVTHRMPNITLAPLRRRS